MYHFIAPFCQTSYCGASPSRPYEITLTLTVVYTDPAEQQSFGGCDKFVFIIKLFAVFIDFHLVHLFGGAITQSCPLARHADIHVQTILPNVNSFTNATVSPPPTAYHQMMYTSRLRSEIQNLITNSDYFFKSNFQVVIFFIRSALRVVVALLRSLWSGGRWTAIVRRS